MDKPAYYSLERITESIRRFFEIADSVDILNITGGEPFLYKELSELLMFIKDNRERINQRLEVFTNGTVIPSDNILSALNAADSSVLLDDYDFSTKTQDIAALFDRHDVTYRLRGYRKSDPYSGGWVDMVDFLDKPRGKAETERLTYDCMLARDPQRANVVIDGKIYVCFSQYWQIQKGILKENPKTCFDLFGDSIELAKKKEKISDFLNNIDLEACSRCKGQIPAISERFPPAVQL
jgi:organic radical activating enzyme